MSFYTSCNDVKAVGKSNLLRPCVLAPFVRLLPHVHLQSMLSVRRPFRLSYHLFVFCQSLTVCPSSVLRPVRLTFVFCQSLPSVCPSTWPSVLPPGHLPRDLSVCPTTCPSVPPPVRLSRHLFVCPASCPSVQSLVRLSRHLFVCPSICSSVPPPVRLSRHLSV